MRTCRVCGKPEKPHRYRHPFVAADSSSTIQSVETPVDWTEQIATRVSKAALAKLDQKLGTGTVQQTSSRAAYMRKLLYIDLGIGGE